MKKWFLIAVCSGMLVEPAVSASTHFDQPTAHTETDSPEVAIPSPTPKALEFHRTSNAFWIAMRAWDLVLPVVLLWTGSAARLARWTRRVARSEFLGAGLFAIVYFSLSYLVDFPWAIYLGYVRAHDYGLSRQSFIHWLVQESKALAVYLALAAVLLPIGYALMRRAGRWWWLVLGSLNIPLVIALVYVVPVVYDPLFNQFGPMTDRALESRILSLAARAGVEGSRVYEVDKSRETTTVNAYVTGLGGTSRIVLWDTLIDKLEPEEVLVVMGHEMGHYVLGHVLISVVLACVLAGFGLFLIDRLGRLLIHRASGRFGFDRIDDVASFPLLVFLWSVLSVAASPVVCAYSRHQEGEADRFAAELTRDSAAGARSFVKLMDENLGVPWPSPLYSVFRATHPSAGSRISFFNNYHPWLEGAPQRYQHLFRME
jgi:Zn-dependent protease with chaperone function